MLNFSNTKFEPVIKKLNDFNLKVKEMAPGLALDDVNRTDTETLKSVISKLGNSSFYHSAIFTTPEILLVVNLCSWPGNFKFPALDILRQMILVESACESIENVVRHLNNKEKGKFFFFLFLFIF